MAIEKKQEVHRPGPFKQINKPHKGGRSHDKKHAKGKINVKTITCTKRRDLNRIERRNKANQIRKRKREEVMLQKRGLGSSNNAPILSVILPLDDAIDANKFLSDLCNCDEDNVVTKNKFDQSHLSFPRQKQRFSFIIPKRHSLYSVMDAVKVADVLILLYPLESSSLDEYSEYLLSVIYAHSLPTTIHVVQGLNTVNPKKKSDFKKNISNYKEVRFPDEKLYSADTNQECQLLLRQISSQKRKRVAFRDARCHMLCEDYEYLPSENEPGCGTLKVSGYVRGQPLDVNGLIHIPGWGNFQMNQIDFVSEPFPTSNKTSKRKSNDTQDEDMALDSVVLSEKADPARQESLQSEVIPDPMEGEQTWPTKEELEAAEIKPKKTVKKVAAGTSDYQAAWIIDSEGSGDDYSDYDSEDDQEIKPASESGSDDAEEEMEEVMDDTESVAEVKDVNYDNNIDMEEEKKMLVRFKEERLNVMFPDEIDTPMETPARVRFQKYRGLKNFAFSPWDPMENLPYDYSRIYRFDNFRLTKKKVLTSEKEGAMPGLYVTVHIKNVPKSLHDNIQPESPLVIYGVLKHEQKMSVINVVIQKHLSCKSSIKSKDALIFHIGYQRFTCRPIFSEHRVGNKFKLERYLPKDSAVVASFYGPVIFPPASVVVFKQLLDGTHELVATGSVMDANPNRVVIKRIVLSGHPFKINKRLSVIRYMFFNKEDIEWFKSVELRSKSGRVGHIKESLGTHGHMKCLFDQQLQSQDVVLMYLYKRTFPKWTYDPYVPTPVDNSLQQTEEMDELM